jgi:lipid A 3-O-deacylase
MKTFYSAVTAVLAGAILCAVPAGAQAPARGEVIAGALAHGVNLRGTPPPGYDQWESEEEGGTVDLQLGWRSAPLAGPAWLLRPRLVAKADINTGGRTSFFSAGGEWRQAVPGTAVYLQAGFGISYHNGYRMTPSPFEPDLPRAELARRIEIYNNRTSLGSKVLFNPNLSIGVRIDERWAVEAVWEHWSHKQVFAEQNPGIDNFGLRLVRTLGR